MCVRTADEDGQGRRGQRDDQRRAGEQRVDDTADALADDGLADVWRERRQTEEAQEDRLSAGTNEETLPGSTSAFLENQTSSSCPATLFSFFTPWNCRRTLPRQNGKPVLERNSLRLQHVLIGWGAGGAGSIII